MVTIGLIINPVAGIGGPAGLKGSDGADIQRRAREAGADSSAQTRVCQVLRTLTPLADRFHLVTAPAEMGQQAALACGLRPTVVGSICTGHTTAEDTMAVARQMAALPVDLLLFAGGDGTARNLCQALGEHGTAALGIPVGVKMHSAVYAKNPTCAAALARDFILGQRRDCCEAEVMDIDEEAFRAGRVEARLYGYLRVLSDRQRMQSGKSGGTSAPETLTDIASTIVDEMERQPQRLYLIGSGTTTRGVMDLLELPNTLLGVDAVRNGRLVAADLSEARLMELVQGTPATAVLSVIGGQGHIFGRGNQQFSPRVLREIGIAHLMLAADPDKLAALPGRVLVVDTGDPQLDQALCGYRSVITGWNQTTMVKVTMD